MAESILIVEDDSDIAESLVYNLKREGFRPVVAESGEKGLRIALDDRSMPSLILLDLMLPGMTGLELCRRLRREETTEKIPIIMLTAKASEADKLAGLDIGADDYVVKPFSPRELAARVKVILRRAAAGGTRQHAPDTGSFAFAGWVLKSGERALVDREGVSVPLSTGEYNLLHALVTRPRQVLTRDQLLDLTQGREAAAFDRAIDNQVSRLRKKIEADPKNPDIIKTVWGGGYTLAAEVTRL